MTRRADYPIGVTVVWLALMALTVLSWLVGHDYHVVGLERIGATTGILIFTFFKIRLVVIHFMEIKHAPLTLRLPFELWCVGVCGILIYMFSGSGHV